MEDDYPRHMKNWRGVPTPLDAVITWKDGKSTVIAITANLRLNNDLFYAGITLIVICIWGLKPSIYFFKQS
jgi:hypothetical protein